MVATKSLSINTQFVAEVEFGMPSKKCNNYGICRINPIGQDKKACTCSKQDIFAVVTVFGANYTEVEFLRSSISDEHYDKFFSKGKFKVIEEYPFTAMDNKEHHFKIATGEYYVIETSSMIKVVFR